MVPQGKPVIYSAIHIVLDETTRISIANEILEVRGSMPTVTIDKGLGELTNSLQGYQRILQPVAFRYYLANG